MADYARLVDEVHRRGMKLYLDQEIQYVAYDHPWFTSALGHPESPYSNFLIWHGPHNSKPEEGPFDITKAARFPSRSAERRVVKEVVSTFRSGGSPCH